MNRIYDAAVLGMDGNCGYCLTGENIQVGEVEFFCVDDAPESLNDKEKERWAMTQAHKRLCKRLNYQLGFRTETNQGEDR